MQRKIGVYQSHGPLSHFIPESLPPHNPSIAYSDKFVTTLSQSVRWLGVIAEMSRRVSDPERFITLYRMKEALASAAISGTTVNFFDLLTTELFEEKPDKHQRIVLNYAKALKAGLGRVAQGREAAFSQICMTEVHALLSQGTYDSAHAIEYRKQTHKVNGFVPCPPSEIVEIMGKLEEYCSSHDYLAPLIKIGLMHAQFHLIYPFEEGNGRISRILLLLNLVEYKLLPHGFLMPSLVIKKQLNEYHQRLHDVQMSGDFESWLDYFFAVIEAACHEVYQITLQIEQVEHALRTQLNNEMKTPRLKELSQRAVNYLFRMPLLTVNMLAHALEKSPDTARQLVDLLVKMGVLVEYGDHKRNKRFKFERYMQIIEKD